LFHKSTDLKFTGFIHTPFAYAENHFDFKAKSIKTGYERPRGTNPAPCLLCSRNPAEEYPEKRD
jgi:hypothetical protein